VLVVLLYLAFIIYGMIMLIASKVYRFYKKVQKKKKDNEEAIKISKSILVEHENIEVAKAVIKTMSKK
jgi:hypothetical protein